MAIPKKIDGFLKKSGLIYEIIEHKTVYTALDKAKTLKVKPNIVAKTLILKADKDMVFALIPADKNLDKVKFKKAVNDFRKKSSLKGFKKIEFVSEKIIKNKIKGVKLGAVPPFGNLFGLPLFTDASLLKQKKIILNSGDYKFSLKIKPALLRKSDLFSAAGNFSRKKQ